MGFGVEGVDEACRRLRDYKLNVTKMRLKTSNALPIGNATKKVLSICWTYLCFNYLKIGYFRLLFYSRDAVDIMWPFLTLKNALTR